LVENLQVLSALLKDHYRVKIAKSGEKALEIAQQEQQPDLILLDIVMPEMDGFTASRAKKIRIAFTYSTSRKSHFRSYTKRKTHS
jgi:putative two-component system response regulator